jgi:flagellar biosynthesis protein FlhB
MSSTEPKTEPASEKKKRDALKKGNRPKSTLVNTAISTLMWMVVGFVGWPAMVALIWPMADGSMNWNITDTRTGIANAGWLLLLSLTFIAVAAFGVTLLAAAVSVGLTHGQLAPAPEALKLKFEKFNPATNAKELFSLKKLYELARNVVYVTVLGWVTWLVAAHYLGDALSLYRSSNNAIRMSAPNIIILAFTVGLGVTAVFAFLDRVIEKLLWLKDLKMTKHEVKKEQEEQNGNPHIKAERTASARQAASSARDDALTYGNLVIYSVTESKIVVMHTNDTFKRPLVLWREKGASADDLARELRTMGAEIVDSTHVTDILYPKAPVGDFLNGKMTELVNQNRSG